MLLKYSGSTQYSVECVCLTFICFASFRKPSVCASVRSTGLICIHRWYWSKDIIYVVVGSIVCLLQFIKHWIWEHCKVILRIRGRPWCCNCIFSVRTTSASMDLVVKIYIWLVHLDTGDSAIRCLLCPKNMIKIFSSSLKSTIFY